MHIFLLTLSLSNEFFRYFAVKGTFGVHEKLANVFEFVAASLHHESAEFSLIAPEGGKFSNEDSEKTLHNLR